VRRSFLSRTTVAICVAVGALFVQFAPVEAAPANAKNAFTFTLQCGAAGSVTILRNATNASARFDASGEGGRVYELESVDIRSYLGDVATEPATPPIFEFVKDYGSRNGYSSSLPCSGRFVINDPGGTFTAFVNVVLIGK
jgi:hypothetical protein